MIRVCIICEGATEVEFVKSCMTSYLLESSVIAYPAILQAPSGKHRGGRVTVDRLANFISHQYDEADRITTLVDYYGFQDLNGRSRSVLEADIIQAVKQIKPNVDERFIIPYVQMYEFEGLLFSDIEQFQFVLDGWNPKRRAMLKAIKDSFDSPEAINNSPLTAPSKRILNIFDNDSYSKTEHGPLIAEEIGIECIRQQCPQFDQWLSRLQAWGDIS